MPQLTGLIVSDDDTFKKETIRLLRAGTLPVSVIDDRLARDGASPDLVVVDIRSTTSGMERMERLRAADPAVSIFAVASEPNPDLIVRAMRAGANEFFTWPLPEQPFREALDRSAARRESSSGVKRLGSTIVFYGVKGGCGTTTMAVNCAVELARLSKRPTVIVDLKAGLGEVGLFLGVRSRYTLLDAIATCTASTASSCASCWSSTSPGWTSLPAPISSIVRPLVIPARSRKCSAC